MLLTFDTSSPTVSVALLDEGEVRVELVSQEAMRHGEQLAPLVEQALQQAGALRLDITAIGVGVGPGPFTGLRVGLVTAKTFGFVLDVPVYGVCSLDVLAVEAVDRGLVSTPFVVATDARRKEVFLAAYDEDGVRAAGPAVDRPALVATAAPVVGEGALLYPDSFPHSVGPARPSAAWLGHVIAGERAEIVDAEPLYLRRPDAEIPRPTQAGLVIRRATAGDADAVARLEVDALGADAWSLPLVAAGVAGEVPMLAYLVAEPDAGAGVVGYAAVSVVGEVSELQRIAVAAPHRRGGVASALLAAVVDVARGGGSERLLLEVREDNAGALTFYDARGFVELDRRRRYYRDGATAVVLSLALAYP